MSKVALKIVIVLLFLAFVLIPFDNAKSIEFAGGAFIMYVGYLGLLDAEEETK